MAKRKAKSDDRDTSEVETVSAFQPCSPNSSSDFIRKTGNSLRHDAVRRARMREHDADGHYMTSCQGVKKLPPGWSS